MESLPQFPSHLLISRLKFGTYKCCLRLSGSLVASFFFLHLHLKPSAQHRLNGSAANCSIPVPAQSTNTVGSPKASFCHNTSSFLMIHPSFSVFALQECVICNFYPYYTIRPRQTAVRSNKIYRNRFFFLFFLDVVDCFVPFYKKNLYES